ncbi:MAG: class I SAM-dependent methyltransferase [Chloroflexota bacterium]|nr:class I SAM-dependent methyltransferase [Chloroflexota bacterium]
MTLSSAVRAALDAHARLLVAWNQHLNLTALRRPDQIARGHVLDSLAGHALCRRLLEAQRVPVNEARLLDLGSGGGYPGLPLSLALGVGRCALVDSVAKKARFLEVAAAAAASVLVGAGVPPPAFDVLGERAEDLAEEADQREGWHLVVARAVGSVAEVAELALPLLSLGGHVVAWKRQSADGGRPDAALAGELRGARRIVQAAGGAQPRVEQLPAADALGLPEHVLVTIRKVRPTPDRYPRPPAERRRTALLR